MIKYWIIFSFLFMLLYPVKVNGVEPSTDVWSCVQPGVVDKSYVLAISRKFYAMPAGHREKQEKFEKVVLEVTDNLFQSDYGCVCANFSSEKEYKKYVSDVIEGAKKRKFKILWISFD